MKIDHEISYSIIRLTFGLIFLLGGGEYLVRGSLGIAKSLKLSPLLIGIVVVGFGTSVPELLTSLLSVVGKTYAPGIAIGNVIGSNIANILLIIGLSAAIAPISKIAVSKLDVYTLIASPILFALAIFCLFVGWQKFVFPLSVIMVITMLIYVIVSWKGGKKREEDEVSLSGLWKDPVFNFAVAFIAIMTMYFGTRQMISEAQFIAEKLGIKETVIGLSIVAVGTSLPELAASIIAAFHKESEISIGNIVGSNIFNILFIPGVTGISATIFAIKGYRDFKFAGGRDIVEDLVVMMVATFLFAILLRKGKISRLWGSIFFTAYVIYMIFIWK